MRKAEFVGNPPGVLKIIKSATLRIKTSYAFLVE
jgi:hypothetical protein